MFRCRSEGKRTHISPFMYGLSRTACDFAAITWLAVTIFLPVQSLRISLIESAWSQAEEGGSHNRDAEDCPEGLGDPQNCNDIERMGAILAERRGWGVEGGRAAFRSRPYEVNVHDCTTGNAEMACLINDPCMAQYGEMKMPRSDSAWHATSMWIGKNGNQFECDFTPGTGYGGGNNLVGGNADATIGDSHPDPGESVDPNYAANNCPMNGANTSPLNPFGTTPGGISSMMSMMMLMALLQNMKKNQTPAPVIGLLPTATPTETPTPTPTTAERILAAVSSGSEESRLNDVVVAADPITDNSNLLAAVSADSSASSKKSAAWEDPRGDIFK